MQKAFPSPNLWLGIGCQRGTSDRVIQHAIDLTLRAYNLDANAIVGIATIDLKADEAGLITYCQRQNLALHTYPAAQLTATIVPHPSDLVAANLKTPSVAEAAALCAAGTDRLLVTKQKCRLDGEPGTVTIAIALTPEN
jgi:cobalt-precorrin 5A hydrolase/precorrin-3B C17-methyltransferase